MHPITVWFVKNWRHLMAWVVLYLITSNLIRLTFDVREGELWPTLVMIFISSGIAEMGASAYAPIRKVSK